MITSAQLKAAVDDLVAEAGTVFDSNENQTGRWKELAEAAEAISGTSSSANAGISGYMKRAAIALEALGGTTGAEESASRFGYLKRIVDALEAWNGSVGTGSLTNRLKLASAALSLALTNQEATDLIARMTVEPGALRRRNIDDLIGALKAAGVWAKLDALYVLAAHDEQAAKLNWIADAFNLADPGATAPAFVANSGFTGDGATDYLDTGFNPTAAAGLYTQNSAHMAVWCGTDVTSVGREVGANEAFIVGRNGTNAAVKTNSAVTDSLPVASSVGWLCWSRSISTAFRWVKDGGAPAEVARASAAVNLPFYVCAMAVAGPVASNFSTRRIQVVHFGSALTDQELADTYAALNAYMQAVVV